MPAADVNGMTIEYDVHGDDAGDPLLLVMGLGGQLVGWPIEFVERLVAKGFRVIRFDNRDVGLSTKTDAPVPHVRRLVAAALSKRFAHSPYVLSDMAADAAGLLDHLGFARAHVVGISMGGMISQTLCIEHPDKVASLTSIMSNTGDRKHGKVKGALLRKLPKLMARNPDDAVANGVELFRLISGPHFDAQRVKKMQQEAFVRDYDPAGPARQLMAVAASPDRTFALGGVRAPTLVVHGLLDALVLPSGGIATARAIPGARLVMYPDMGHDLPLPRWDELIDEIVENTRRAEPGDAAGDRAPAA
ncbi:MAG: alpha/beta fold hydrolase [Actinomycetota bacterium]|nr:alpha/beta fold hydrolase [Actinomycetota bacterium]